MVPRRQCVTKWHCLRVAALITLSGVKTTVENVKTLVISSEERQLRQCTQLLAFFFAPSTKAHTCRRRTHTLLELKNRPRQQIEHLVLRSFQIWRRYISPLLR